MKDIKWTDSLVSCFGDWLCLHKDEEWFEHKTGTELMKMWIEKEQTPDGGMKTEEEIRKGLQDMETRKNSYLLDMASYKAPGEVQYDTELIRKLEVTDATIHTLKWVLTPTKTPSDKLERGQ